jgi:hypothetical protein
MDHGQEQSFRPPAEGEVLLFCLSKREVPSNCLERLSLWRRGDGEPLIAQPGIEYDQELSH